MTRGLVLGKFLPPHAGHVYLCEFARHWADELAIVVGTLRAEPIPGELRWRWMRELFPREAVIHLTDENPQHPSEHPEFWSIWKASLERVLPWRPDVVFASDDYGQTLADVLGARFVAVDSGRSVMPVSGTAVRADPLAHWAFLPACVRPHFVKRVSVFGPESTGKTTLARALAARFGTCAVPEWARTLLERRGGALEGLDWDDVVRGQAASEEALARAADRVLICDTDPLLTTVWASALLGACPPSIAAAAAGRRYDLTLLTDPDVPWVADPVRYLPGGGREFFARCEEALRAAGRGGGGGGGEIVVLRGTWAERTAAAVDAIHDRLGVAPRA